MSTGELIINDTSRELTTEEQINPDEAMCKALEEAWADEKYLAEWLVDIADNAYTMTPKGEPYPDYNSRLQALKEIRKIKSNKPDVQVNIANVFWSAGWNL